MLAHRAHEKGIEIGATVSSDVPEFMSFDPARLRQVLFNVIGNAVKFTQAGGVFIRVSLNGDDLVITVSDSGPGMTAEEQARIFGEFEQGGTMMEKSGGTGLGLTISARIMREFGGSLTVASEKGKGSEFTIRFPTDIPEERRGRRNSLLAGNTVLLLAPAGAARAAIAETIIALGGDCHLVADGEKARANAARHRSATATGRPTSLSITACLPNLPSTLPIVSKLPLSVCARSLLVNPEERNAHPLDLFDAWLIRPLREQSLIDVLRGRMRGMEKRDALNDNQPGFAAAIPEANMHGGLNILLGEDDPINAMLVRAMLEKGGHRVHHVEDFETLLDCALAEGSTRPDIIISDLTMPGGEGVEMIGRLRGHERRLRARSRAGDRADCRQPRRVAPPGAAGRCKSCHAETRRPDPATDGSPCRRSSFRPPRRSALRQGDTERRFSVNFMSLSCRIEVFYDTP